MIPKIPEEFKGKQTSKTEYTNTAPRKWTNEEINWVKNLQEQGYSAKEIAESVGRTQTSVAIKIKRLGKSNNTYNAKHVLEKYEINKRFLDDIKPQSVLDLYCGEKNFYKEYDVVSNDIDKNISAEYHLDAFKLLCHLYFEDKSFDLVDLDPFGSAYDCFDLAIKLAKKGIVITLGELGHKRWKRLDFVRRYYNITNVDDFTIENLIKYIQQIGQRNKKKLVVYEYRKWQNIGRVWFTIEPLKILESQVKDKN